MFNSKKKQAAAEAAQAMRAQAVALQAQLDEVRSERASLEVRISTVDEASEQLVQRLTAVDERVAETDGRINAINDRLGQVEAIGSELDGINERLQAFSLAPPTAPAPPTPPPPPPPPLIADNAPDDLNERIVELRQQLDDLAQQTSSIDARVTSVSMELANQLTELSSDIDELNRRSSESTGTDPTADIDTTELEARISERLDAAMDDVLESTERLATEQARYEIQFRSDLADLAERLRRPGTT